MDKLAIALDALRIIPRLVLFLYLLANSLMLNWYLEFPIVPIITCDDRVIATVLENKGSIEQAERIGCRQTDVIGRPTGYTALVSTLVGSSAVVFGFYCNSGGIRYRVKAHEEKNS